jgi:aspartate kinase
MDLIHSYGERMSVVLLSSALKKRSIDSQALEADVIGMITDGVFSHASVRFEEATPKLRASLIPLAKRLVPVVTGYFGCDERGRTTTFGRGGSDYTAAVLASSLDASCVELWKDVDGFMSADPKVVKDAHLIRNLSYDEAAELAYFGSKILHPRAVEPLIQKGIPLHIRNTKDRKGRGSIVSGKRLAEENVVKSVARTSNIGFLKIQGPAVGYKPGVLMNIVTRLSADGINIKSVLTAQTCINILLDGTDTSAGMRSLEGLYEGSIANIERVDGIGLIAVVGEGLIEKRGLGARVLKAVADRGVNVEMVAAGASKVAMYFLIKEKAMNEAVRAIHGEFFQRSR